ncbi:hypothetical protein D8M04_15175 [Oceanobacillus piezotolerans]|uniref:Uncharacterized protein n=1 Tax=Oceanobacillus piezotolerans TaxID=2448030 RepID=A0A498DFW1_9BACI|nr:hypothetical protein [Oceanobacillus piezotolerans]RLL42888.1 hypothetical protein D8M04_15175 [Oceanobacillus piezotolerans]
MYLLNHQYEIKVFENIMFVHDSISDEVKFAFEIYNLDKGKLKKLFYFGLEKTISFHREEQIVQKVVQRYPNYFTNCNDLKRNCFRLIREYTELFRYEFISTQHFSDYLKEVEVFLKRKKRMKLLFDIEGYEYIKQAFQNNPLMEITGVQGEVLNDTQETFDVIITEPNGEREDRKWLERAEAIMFLNTDSKKIAIGPLIYVKKFQIPSFANEEPKEYPIILEQEQHLLYYFIERILYIYAFNLNQKLLKDTCIPVRHSLILDRVDLKGYSKTVTIYPRVETLVDAVK